MKKIKCNLCGADNYSLVFSGVDRFYNIDDTVFDLVKCNICGLVYINPQPNNEELKRYYPSEYGPYQDNFQLLKYNSFLNFIKKIFNKFKSVSKNNQKSKTDESKKTFLDFGCGSGAYLEKMRRLHPNWILHGLDNNKFACENTISKGFDVFCGDFLNLEITQDFFDEVYLGQVIEHMPDPRKTIQKINSIMKKGGTLTLGTPNIESFSAKLFKSYWFALEVPRHLFLFSPKTLSDLLKKEGFEILGIEYDKEPKTTIRSLDYVFGGNSTNINPLFWHAVWYLLKPVSYFLSFFGKTSIMVIHAKKV